MFIGVAIRIISIEYLSEPTVLVVVWKFMIARMPNADVPSA